MAGNSVFRVYDDEEAMLKIYQRRLKMADKKFEKKFKTQVDTLFRMYQGDMIDDLDITDTGETVQVMTPTSIVDTMFSSMTAVDVEFICSIIGHGTELQALAAERGLNQAWRDSRGSEETKAAVKDAHIAPMGWVKVYYDYVKDVETRDKPEAALEAEYQEAKGANGALTPDDFLLTAKMVEQVEVVLRDRICIDYVPWDMVRYDPSAKRMKDVRWVAQYTALPVEEVRQNPTWVAFVEKRYGKAKADELLRDLAGDSKIFSGIDDASEYIGDQPDEYGDDDRVTVVEMWDFETGLVTTSPKDNLELVLYQRTNPLMMNLDNRDRSPFKPLVLRKDSKSFEGTADLKLIKPSVDEERRYRNRIMVHTERATPKIFGPAEALDDAGKEAVESNEWLAFVPLRQQHSWQEFGSPDMPKLEQEVYQMPQRIHDEIERGVGANEVLQGIFPDKRTTATETQLVTNSGQRRQAERASAYTDWLVGIAKTALQLMQQFYDANRMLRYTDDLGQEFTWEWNSEDIAIDADIEIVITPKEQLTRSERVQRAMQAFNVAAPLPFADQYSLAQMLFREMGFRDDEIRKMVRSPEEVQKEQQAQQEQQAALSITPQQRGNAPPGLAISQ
jgi:hypothetical protein